MLRKVLAPMRRLLIVTAILLIHGQPAEALLLWNWSYSGNEVSASGTFTTNDAPDGAGFYQIVGITGIDNGVTITGLQPTGTAIPGNEPFGRAFCRARLWLTQTQGGNGGARRTIGH